MAPSGFAPSGYAIEPTPLFNFGQGIVVGCGKHTIAKSLAFYLP